MVATYYNLLIFLVKTRLKILDSFFIVSLLILTFSGPTLLEEPHLKSSQTQPDFL